MDDTAYWEAYNAVRADSQRCGKGWIPDDAECQNGQSDKPRMSTASKIALGGAAATGVLSAGIGIHKVAKLSRAKRKNKEAMASLQKQEAELNRRQAKRNARPKAAPVKTNMPEVLEEVRQHLRENPETAAKIAGEARKKQHKRNSRDDHLSPYQQAYNQARTDSQRCGKGWIPDDSVCHIGKGKTSPNKRQNRSQPKPRKSGTGGGLGIAIGGAIALAATGGITTAAILANKKNEGKGKSKPIQKPTAKTADQPVAQVTMQLQKQQSSEASSKPAAKPVVPEDTPRPPEVEGLTAKDFEKIGLSNNYQKWEPEKPELLKGDPWQGPDGEDVNLLTLNEYRDKIYKEIPQSDAPQNRKEVEKLVNRFKEDPVDALDIFKLTRVTLGQEAASRNAPDFKSKDELLSSYKDVVLKGMTDREVKPEMAKMQAVFQAANSAPEDQREQAQIQAFHVARQLFYTRMREGYRKQAHAADQYNLFVDRKNKKGRSDSVYWQSYAAVRADSKRCGKGWIPDDWECHVGKGEGGEAAGTAQAIAGQGAKAQSKTPSKPSSAKSNKSSGSLSKTARNAAMIAAVGTAAGAAAVGTAVSTISHDVQVSAIPKEKPTLRRPPDGIPDAETMAVYDTFEPGQMVRKMFFQPGTELRRYHYGVYVGKNQEGVHEMIEVTMGPEGQGGETRPRIVRTPLDRPIEESGTQFEAVPKEEMYLTEGTKQYSPEEIVQRAESLLDRNFIWNGFESNCESLARAITEGKAYATQADRVTGFTTAASKVVGAAASSFDPKNGQSKFNDYILDNTKISAQEAVWELEGAPTANIERELRRKRKEHRHRQKRKQTAAATNTDAAMEMTPELQQQAVQAIQDKVIEFESMFGGIDVTGDLLTHLYKAQFMQLLLAAGVKIDDPRYQNEGPADPAVAQQAPERQQAPEQQQPQQQLQQDSVDGYALGYATVRCDRNLFARKRKFIEAENRGPDGQPFVQFIEEADEQLKRAYAEVLQAGVGLPPIDELRKELLVLARGDLQNYQDQIKLFRVGTGVDGPSPGVPIYRTTREAREAGWANVIEFDPIAAGMGRKQYDSVFNRLNGVEGEQPMSAQRLRFWSQLLYTNQRAFKRSTVRRLRENKSQLMGPDYRESKALHSDSAYGWSYDQARAQLLTPDHSLL